MRIAITIWNNRVSPVFDVTGQAMLFEAEDGRISSEKLLQLPQVPPVEKLACLREAHTDVLICGAISLEAHSAAISAGMRVYTFISGDVREILTACLTGRLEEAVFAMPGCACRMSCSGKRNQGRGRRRVTGPALFCRQETRKQEV